MVFWLKYWVVFSVFEWIFDILINNGLSMLPLIYLFKLFVILWLQLPFIPLFNTKLLYHYVNLPWYIMDVSHIRNNFVSNQHQHKTSALAVDDSNKPVNANKSKVN